MTKANPSRAVRVPLVDDEGASTGFMMLSVTGPAADKIEKMLADDPAQIPMVEFIEKLEELLAAGIQ